MNASLRSLMRAPVAIVVTTLLMLAAVFVPVARADDADVGFEPPQGVPFFLLADAAWGSTDEAKVRLTVSQSHLSAIEEAGGVDIALYRVADPMAFLRKQRNLHRIDLAAARQPDGLAPTLDYLWSAWWLRARRIWQNVFDGSTRTAVTAAAPDLKTREGISRPPDYRYPSPYRALPGLKELERFRYPVSYARPIEPPKELKLAGSSSNFRPPQDGNVHVPLGQREPGLYVVEASVGRQRAVTLLFVADTMAVTKTAARQFFVWTAERQGGRPVSAEVVWTDLNGVLGSGNTDADGVLAFERDVPQTSYAFGVDRQGGVFISENYYYDSEIHATKLYAYTDRPLYRPGDEVRIRIQGRDFESATRSRAMPAGTLDLRVLDATGDAIFRQSLSYHTENGADARLTLPVTAPAGGYEIRIQRGEDEYGAAFRVASYVKPNLEVHVEPQFAAGADGFKTREAIRGRVRLAYADGEPVRKAKVTLSARAQRLTMVDGDLRYSGAFPVQIDNNQELTTDDQGLISFALPAVDEPSRVVLSVLAEDQAAQRVRATRELLIERAAAHWTLRPTRQFAAADESIRWSLSPAGDSPSEARPAKWVAIHPASQTRTEGSIAAGSGPLGFDLKLAQPGPYTIEIRDDAGRMLAAAPFQVTGGGLKPPEGTIAIVFDRPRYRAGDTARALITFPDKVDDALLTLERDRVERHARIGSNHGFARVKPVGERQVEALIPVEASHAPNITFSVASLAGGRFAFQNAGIIVEQPALAVEVRSDKTIYRPGETARLSFQARDAEGRPAPAVLSVAVVDEMIYALQPELAPTVGEFFHHVRRNNVRTHSSQSFIAYDEASDALVPPAARPRTRERAVKMLERPRRDERDTALFEPALRTDADGRAEISFVVPDALTRWRITAKAYGRERADGLVGERLAWVQSDQPFFVRWTAPAWARHGDKPVASVTVFNQTPTSERLHLRIDLDGKRSVQTIEARPGPTFVNLPIDAAGPTADANANPTRDVTIELARGSQDAQAVDRLATRFTVHPVGWARDREALVPVAAGDSQSPLSLPADAHNLVARVVGPGAAAWSRIADSLIDYPYGCVEQTASRLLPLSWAVRSLDASLPQQSPLRQRLANARQRLTSLAGPEAVFGWWGPGTQDDLMLTAYAYLADAHASRTLGLDRPAEHWEHLLTVYRDRAAGASLLQRAWALWMMQEIGLPTATLTDGLISALARAKAATGGDEGTHAAAAFGARSGDLTGPDRAVLLTAMLARANNRPWPTALDNAIEQARERLDRDPSLLGQAMRVAAGRAAADGDALADALSRASADTPTVDRALAMLLLARTPGLGIGTGRGTAGLPDPLLVPASGWAQTRSPTGQPQFVPQAGGMRPQSIDWQSPASESLLLAVRYRSSDAAGMQSLPATIQRRLYKLVRDGDKYRTEAVAAGSPLSTTALYLDEVIVSAQGPIAHALAELALPPGGQLEPTTWGIRLAGEEDKPLPRPVAEATTQGYTAPIDRMVAGEKTTLRHLVRFAQKGAFGLPPARLWTMYAPERQSVESGAPRQAWTIQ